jgi:hypothetical protein
MESMYMTSQRRFSPGETKLYNLLPPDGTKMTTTELTKLYYQDREDGEPEHARVTVVGLVRSLVNKTSKMHTVRKVRRTQRQGPKPLEVWLEKVSRRNSVSVQDDLQGEA